MGVLLGKLQGKLEGKIEGETTLLELLLVKRFRGITENTRARLKTATAEQLEDGTRSYGTRQK
jgi:hypothetical protein